MQCITTEKQSNQINTLWWNKERVEHDSQIARAKEHLKLSEDVTSQRQAPGTNPWTKA